MAFDPTINLGNILTGAVTIAGIMWAYHKWDTKVELRHQANKLQIESIDQKVDRVEAKIDDNTKTTNGIGVKMNDLKIQVEKHCAVDEAIQRDISRRLDKIEK